MLKLHKVLLEFAMGIDAVPGFPRAMIHIISAHQAGVRIGLLPSDVLMPNSIAAADVTQNRTKAVGESMPGAILGALEHPLPCYDCHKEQLHVS